MDIELTNYLRISPYLYANLAQHRPTAILPQANAKNHITIAPTKSLHFYSLSQNISQESNQITIQQPPFCPVNCFFCKKISQHNRQHSNCSECRRPVCASCERHCGKCGVIFCQMDITYDYSSQCETCFNCT